MQSSRFIMEQNALLKKNLWNIAGIAGLALGAISAAYMFAEQVIAGNLEQPSMLKQLIAYALWGIKFVGCIMVMKFFMKKFASENKEADNRMTFRMGMAAAFLSALLFSAVSFANMAYFSTDYFEMVYETLYQQMQPMMDSNTASVFSQVVDIAPQLSFFYNLVYCFLFGTVLSAVLSRNIPSRDPFADYKPDEQ